MGLGGAHPEVERRVESEKDRGHERDLLRGGPGRKGETDCRVCLFGVFCCFSCLAITLWHSKTPLQSTQGGCGAERRRQAAPVFHPVAIMPSTLLKRQEHPPRKAPRDKPLTSSRGQQTVACLSLEVLKSQPKSRKK